jgi:replicative DNA helicase
VNIEQQLLSTISSEPMILNTLEITAGEFADLNCGRVFEVMAGLIHSKKTPDIIMVAELLHFDSNENWMPLLGDIYSLPPVPENARAYARIIKQAHEVREAKRLGMKFVNEIGKDPTPAIANMINSLKSVQVGEGSGMRSVRDILPAVIDRIDELSSGKRSSGVKSGIHNLDRLLGGFQPSDMIVIGARPGVGKTAVMCNFAVNAGVSVGIISAEQSDEQIVQRLLSKMGQVEGQRIRSGKLQGADHKRLVDAASELVQSNIYISDQSLPSIDEVEQKARRLIWEKDIKILFVDYLQYVRSSKYKERYLQVGDVSSRLKALAKELQIPIVALAQLNRDVADRDPKISDLRESGSIEQDADQIILLNRDEEKEREIKLHVAKNRHGPCAMVEAGWIPETMTLTNLSG